jgi:hypothetical protein
MRPSGLEQSRYDRCPRPGCGTLLGGTGAGASHTRWSLKSDMAVTRASIWCAKHGMTAARIWEDTAQ